jgi:hypothetical protein
VRCLHLGTISPTVAVPLLCPDKHLAGIATWLGTSKATVNLGTEESLERSISYKTSSQVTKQDLGPHQKDKVK